MSSTHGVFQHVPGYFYTTLEEDFCEVYKAEGKNEVCRAYITSILEHLTNKQYEATGSDTDIWVFMSLPEMSRRMRHAFGERTIHKEIQGMIADGYLFKRRASGKATMEYKLNLRKLRKALEALPEKQSCNNATYHLANLQDQSSIIARSTLQNSKNNLAELQPRITIEEPLELPENKEREGVSANASTPLAFSAHPENDSHSHSAPGKPAGYTNQSEHEEDDSPTEGRMPVVTTGKQFKRVVLPPKQKTLPLEPAAPESPPTAEGSSGSAREAAPGEPDPAVIDLLLHPERLRNVTQERTQEKPKRGRRTPQEVHLTPHEQEIKEWYEELRGVSVSFSKRNITALAALGKRAMSKDDFLNVTAVLDSDKWFEEHKVGVDLYWINFHWENKIVYLHRKQAPPQEENVYKSLDAMLAIKAGTRQQKVQGSHD